MLRAASIEETKQSSIQSVTFATAANVAAPSTINTMMKDVTDDDTHNGAILFVFTANEILGDWATQRLLTVSVVAFATVLIDSRVLLRPYAPSANTKWRMEQLPYILLGYFASYQE
jgi:hypothetical protein